MGILSYAFFISGGFFEASHVGLPVVAFIQLLLGSFTFGVIGLLLFCFFIAIPIAAITQWRKTLHVITALIFAVVIVAAIVVLIFMVWDYLPALWAMAQPYLQRPLEWLINGVAFVGLSFALALVLRGVWAICLWLFGGQSSNLPLDQLELED